MSQAKGESKAGAVRGAMAWMARNPVAANLLMAIFLAGGFIMSRGLKQEVFPEFTVDVVTIQVAYPGADPEEVEKGILVALEEAVRGLDGVKEVRSTALEGVGIVTVELLQGVDPNKALSDVKNAVDRVTTLPDDAERPLVSLASTRHPAIALILYGDLDQRTLRKAAEQAREDLLATGKVTQIDIVGIREPEISIEVSQDALRRYGLTLPVVALAVRRAALDLPAGAIRTVGGEILVRAKERRYHAQEFADIPVLARPDGSVVRLRDVATLHDTLADTDIYSFFNGHPAVRLQVYRVGDETPLSVGAAVKEYAATLREHLPKGMGVAVWSDWSQLYHDRIDLLLRNGRIGLILVLLLLGLFLEIRLAFWVTLGIPISFLGAFLFLRAWGVSINMISLFAFIVTLGMVVDDAIVIGENVYEYVERGHGYLRAAILGARDIAMPVVFAVLTTMVAFAPMFFISGVSGKLFRVIPAVVITVLGISLAEALFILPSHLGHMRPVRDKGVYGFIHHQQQRIARGLQWFIEHLYRPVVGGAVRHRYFTAVLSFVILVVSVAYIGGGHIPFTFMPRIESDLVTATVYLPVGAPVEETRRIERRLVETAKQVVAENGGDRILRGIYSQIGKAIVRMGPVQAANIAQGGHITSVQVFMVPVDQRRVSAEAFARRWRELVGPLPQAERVGFKYSTGPSAGAAIDVELSHRDTATLDGAALQLAAALRGIDGVRDVDSGVTRGKPQLDLRLTPLGASLGLTVEDLARQVRGAFWGNEAVRVQRGRDEVRIYVRLPRADRRTDRTLEDLVVRTPTGGEIPLREAATWTWTRSPVGIDRTEGRRIVHVTADVDMAVVTPDRVARVLTSRIMPGLERDVPGLHWRFGGERKEQREVLAELKRLFAVALLVMFAMIAVPFRSYIQPFIVMSTIPFGIVGALIGHIALGYNMSIISMLGVVALAGVVVNDSLVLVDAANRFREERGSVFEGVVAAGVRRFRPIMLTSLTTFFGLVPMIFETSIQARFLIPMAISLGFGVMFSTFITLLVVPAYYLIVDDIVSLLWGHHAGVESGAPPDAGDPPAGPASVSPTA